MADTLKARDAKDVENAVVWALADGKTLEIAGQGSKRAIGRPSQSDITLDLSALSGVTLYEPEELVLSARAGTPIAVIEKLVADHGQELAFEPMDYGPVLGQPAGAGTIGGVLAMNLSGPRRIKAGAARDHFLGFTAVSGRGETFKSGGRVVKNVTGYDLSKLLCGSYGTLAAMTDVTIKTLPKAETEATVILTHIDPATATRAMTDAMGSSCEVSGAAYLPSGAASRIDGFSDPAMAAFRLEGVVPSVTHRRDVLAALLRPHGTCEMLEAQGSRDLWRAIRDVMPFAAEPERPLWRLSTAPSRGAALAARLADESGANYLLNWAGGLVWLSMPSSDDAGASQIRGLLGPDGGHATLIRAPAAIRAAAAVFQPQADGVAALTRRVKDAFDPRGILNPGRMWAGV